MANTLSIVKIFIWIYVYVAYCFSDGKSAMKLGLQKVEFCTVTKHAEKRLSLRNLTQNKGRFWLCNYYSENNVIFTNQPCPEGQEGVFYAVDHSPSQYKHCGPAGFFWIFPCSPGTYFNQMEQACVSNTTTLSYKIFKPTGAYKSTSMLTTPPTTTLSVQDQYTTSYYRAPTTLERILYTKPSTTAAEQLVTPTSSATQSYVPSVLSTTTTSVKSTTILQKLFSTVTQSAPVIPEMFTSPKTELSHDEDNNANLDYQAETTTSSFGAVQPKIFATASSHPEEYEEYPDYEQGHEHNHANKNNHHSHAITIIVTAAPSNKSVKSEDVEYWNENTGESPPIPLHPQEKNSLVELSKLPESPVHAHDPDVHNPDYESVLQPSFVPLEKQNFTIESTNKVKENYEYFFMQGTKAPVTEDYFPVDLPTPSVYKGHEKQGNVKTSETLVDPPVIPEANFEVPTETEEDPYWSEYETKLQVKPPQYETNLPAFQYSTESPSFIDYSVQAPKPEQEEVNYVSHPEYPQTIDFVKTIDPDPNAYEIKHNEEEQPIPYNYMNFYQSTENIVPRTPSSKALPKSTATLSPQAQELAKQISEQDLESMRRVFERIASAAGGGGQGSFLPPGAGQGGFMPPGGSQGGFVPPAFQLPPNVLNNQFMGGQPSPNYMEFMKNMNQFAPYKPPPITEIPPVIIMVPECKENGTCEFNAVIETYCLHESNPTFYYQCGPSADDTGVWMNRQCPAGLHFNDDGQCGKKRKITTGDNSAASSAITAAPTAETPDYLEPNQYILNTITPVKSNVPSYPERNNFVPPAMPVQPQPQASHETVMPVYIEHPNAQINADRYETQKPSILDPNVYVQQIVQRPIYPKPQQNRIISPSNSFLQFPEQQTSYPGNYRPDNVNRNLALPYSQGRNLAKWVVDQQPTRQPIIPSPAYNNIPAHSVQTVRGGFLPDTVVAKLANLDSMAQAIAAKNVFDRTSVNTGVHGQDAFVNAIKQAGQQVQQTSQAQNYLSTYGTNYLAAGNPVSYAQNPYKQLAMLTNRNAAYNANAAALQQQHTDYVNNQRNLLIPRQPVYPRPQYGTSRDEASIVWQNRGSGEADKSPEGINVWRPTPGQRCSLLASPRAQVFSNPDDFKSFYMCMPVKDDLNLNSDSAEGSWALLQCPEDTVFNASLKVCDRSYTDFKQKKLTS